MKKLLILTIALAAVLCSALFPLGIAYAHATLVRADPSPNSVLSVSPSSLTLWFDEELDPQFSTVSLIDKNQSGVDLKNVKFSADRKQMSVGVRPNLPPGAYTVSWRALSAVDGHVTKGIFAIFIGAASAGQAAPINPTNSEASVLPLPIDVGVRWINLLAALSLCGALTLNLLMGDEGEDFKVVRAAAAQRLRIWVVINLIVLFVGSVLSQLLQAAAASDKTLAEVITQSIWLSTLTTTRFGQAGLARILLVDSLMVLFVSVGASIERRRIKRLLNVRAFDLVYVGMAALILLSISLASHGASSNDPLKLALLADWLHLLAIGAWTGGLFALTLVLRPALNALPETTRWPIAYQLLRRFSNLAVASVALFALSGLYSLWRQVGYANALVSTPYGLTLIIKHVFIVPLLLLGALNTLLLRPELLAKLRVASSEWRILNRLSQFAIRNSQIAILNFVRLEAVLGALVILAAAALTALPPARTAASPPLPPPFQATRQSADATISLKVDPYIVGNDTFEVRVADNQGNLLPNVTRVNLRFTFLGADLGTATAEATPVGNGVYKTQGGYLSVVGAWKVETVIRRKDVEDDLRIAYRLNVIDPATRRADELPNISSALLFAIFDLIAGMALLIYASRKNIPEGRWIGAGALALGLSLFIISTFLAPSASAGVMINPIAPDENSLAQGKAVYDSHCAVCHGPQGRGNGPLAANLNPRPSDFVQHINLHSDEVLFNWISKGVPGTAMAGWEDKLSETQRWHTLNHIQALVERASAAAPTPTRVFSSTSAIDPQALLARSDAAMNQLRSLVEFQRLSDDSGNSVTATFEFLAPDKLRYKVSTGMQSAAINDTQYYWEPGKAMEKVQRVEPLRWPNFNYAADASQLQFEGEEMIDGELCAVISFKAPKVDLYRHWIGERTGWLRKQQMDAPDHHMLSTFSQFNAPLVIVAPP